MVPYTKLVDVGQVYEYLWPKNNVHGWNFKENERVLGLHTIYRQGKE